MHVQFECLQIHALLQGSSVCASRYIAHSVIPSLCRVFLFLAVQKGYNLVWVHKDSEQQQRVVEGECHTYKALNRLLVEQYAKVACLFRKFLLSANYLISSNRCRPLIAGLAH